MANPFVHVELSSNDLPAAKTFYSSLFAWKLDEMPMGPGMTYTTISPGDGTGGGMMNNPVPGTPSFWLPYVNVDDINASTKKAESLGGKVMHPVTPVAEMGWFSVISDPSGAALGLWQTRTA
ncbi:MAG: VOC family protein [Ramlibacter sp.]|nr:VOC family protein [Ramlibacter sp.]